MSEGARIFSMQIGQFLLYSLRGTNSAVRKQLHSWSYIHGDTGMLCNENGDMTKKGAIKGRSLRIVWLWSSNHQHWTRQHQIPLRCLTGNYRRATKGISMTLGLRKSWVNASWSSAISAITRLWKTCWKLSWGCIKSCWCSKSRWGHFEQIKTTSSA